MTHVLFVFGAHLEKGGTENVMVSLFNNLDKTRFQIDFLLLDDSPVENPQEDALRAAGARIFYIVRRKTDWREHCRQLDDFFATHPYDVVHTHMDCIGGEVMRYARHYGVPCRVAHSHSTQQIVSPKTIREIAHQLLVTTEMYALRRNSTQYVACSEIAGLWLFGKRICADPRRYHLLKNGIDMARYRFSSEMRSQIRRSLGLSAQTRVLGQVARFDENKNQPFTLELFCALHEQYPDSALIFVGDGETRKSVEQMAKARGVLSSVRFLGWRSDIPALLAGFDVLMLPSHYEGLPLTVIEGQAAGCPCLVSDAVSAECAITPLVEQYPLAEKDIWLSRLIALSVPEAPRADYITALSAAGYDAAKSVHTLEEIYDRGLKQG